MTPPLLLAAYVALIVAASVGGGLIPLVLRLTHTRLQVAISGIAGFVLGVAVLHMIPHALNDLGAGPAMYALLVGFLVMFFIERIFSFHTHEVAELDDRGRVLTKSADLPSHEAHDHAHHHHHAHAHTMVGNAPGSRLSWAGAAMGMGLHSVIEGIALAAAVAAESIGHQVGLAGLAVLLVIVLHKPLDALTVVTLTASAGYAKSTRHLINGLFALIVPLGVAIFALGLNHTAWGVSGELVGYALAFSAGTFLCIALSDLLPELHFHSHDRLKLSTALLVGVALAIATAQLEHQFHDHSPGTPGSFPENDHHGPSGHVH